MRHIRHILMGMAVASVAMLAVPAWAVDIVVPTGAGQGSESTWYPFERAFDSQPTWDNVYAEPSGGGTTGGNVPVYANGVGYIDFGPDWADVRITETWTLYRAYSGTSLYTYYGYDSMWWDDDIDSTNDGTTETVLDFFTGGDGAYIPHDGSERWLRDADCRFSQVTPAARYLMLTTSISTGERAKEFAIVGYIYGTNIEPIVEAGDDIVINPPNDTVNLDASVIDDGLPDPPAGFTVLWTKVSGPGTVTFGDDESIDTTATMSVDGQYVLRITADDGTLSDYDEITVTINDGPSVDAGSDALGSVASGAALDGTITDDDLPDPPGAVTATWSKTSGPGDVTFVDANAVDTTANFSTDGVYVLRLTGDDGDVVEYDEVTITVNAPPSVDAGADEMITLPTDEVSLDGTVSDDGIPTTPGTVSVLWSKTSGPGTVTFDDDEAVDTDAEFSAAGTYVLRLTADDGHLTVYDEVIINVNIPAASMGILSITEAGAVAGGWFPLQYAFDAQPTWDDINEEPTGGSGGSNAPAYGDRYGYIDFGPNWPFYRIKGTWTKYLANSGSAYYTHPGYEAMWWDDDIDRLNDEGFDETTLDFNAGVDVPHVGSEIWHPDVDCSSTPVAPAGRYLVLKTPSSFGARAVEYAIVGSNYTPTIGLITPTGAGQAGSAGWFPLQYAFDSQPTWDSNNAEPTGGGTSGSNVPSYDDRYGYIDFGPDYRKVRITGTWTLYRTYSGTAIYDHSGFAEMWWDDDTDDWNDGVDETTLNFNHASYLPHTGQMLWAQDAAVDLADAIIPAHRYLILKSCHEQTSRAAEFAIEGWVNDLAAPTPAGVPESPILTLDRPQTFNYAGLTLVDEIFPGDDNETHTLIESSSGVSEIQTILGEQVRVIPNVGDEPKYFSYVIGEDCDLVAGDAYILVVEYPEDRSRSMVVRNAGCETNRGFHTGTTTGDCLETWYVHSNPESLHYGFSGEIEKWEELFYLHDRFSGIENAGSSGERPYLPDDGFHVVIAQYAAEQDPTSAGAAVYRIALYEAPTIENYTQTLAELPAGLPKRHIFWREEMSDGVIRSSVSTQRGVAVDADWYEYKARLSKFLGINTFSKDLLEFGHNQGWDCAKYSGHSSEWFKRSDFAHRWEQILTMLAKGGYDLDVLPYYEYAGSDGDGDAALGRKLRSRPLGDINSDGYYDENDPYTHISWSEINNIDVSDPDALTDVERVLEQTITILYEGNRPEQIPFSGICSPAPGAWGYIDFGVDYDDVRICQTWTQSRLWHGGDASPFTDVYWHDDPTEFGETIPQDAVEETTINFITTEQYNGEYHWEKDVETTSSPITPAARYLVLKSADPITDCAEFLIVGYIDGQGTDLETIAVSSGYLGAASLSRMFDNQPDFNNYGGVNVIGAWFRPRVSAIPMGFDEATTLARFSADESISPAVTRDDLEASQALLDDYYAWWYDERKDFLNNVKSYLRTNVNPDAVVIYTYDHTESGVTHPTDTPSMVCDDLAFWGDVSSDPMLYEDAVDSDYHYEAMTLPKSTWSFWEWHHSVPRGDPANYQSNEGVMMEYVFNRMYTTADPDWFDEYQTQSGLAAIYHYCLNEHMMTDDSYNEILGYFVCDMELAGPYCTLPEARTVAYGNPTYIGYLSSSCYNRGFPGYVREFNSNFLALPALPMTDETSATTEPDVVVRSISTANDGTWLAIINVGFEDLEDVEITLPVSGTTTDAVTGSAITVTSGKITLDLWPGRLKSIHIDN